MLPFLSIEKSRKCTTKLMADKTSVQIPNYFLKIIGQGIPELTNQVREKCKMGQPN